MTLFETEFYFAAGETQLTALMKPLETAADIHARNLGLGIDRLMQQGQSWVLGRYFGECLRQLSHGEALRLSTFPSKADRFVTCRDFILEDVQEQIVAHFRTEWLILDLQSRRPVKLPDHLPSLIFRPAQPEPLLIDFTAKAEHAPAVAHTVTEADLDVNGHMNNRRYVELLAGQAPLLRDWLPRYFDIRFRNEALPGDRLVLQTETADQEVAGRMETDSGKPVMSLQASFAGA